MSNPQPGARPPATLRMRGTGEAVRSHMRLPGLRRPNAMGRDADRQRTCRRRPSRLRADGAVRPARPWQPCAAEMTIEMMYLPDFTISWQGETWFWEHWGMMSSDCYQEHRERKIAWYDKNFPGRLIETFEGPRLSRDVAAHISRHFTG